MNAVTMDNAKIFWQFMSKSRNLAKICEKRLQPELRTRSIFNRVRVQEVFASPRLSSSSENFIFRVQVRVRQKRPSSSSCSSLQPWTL